MRGESRRCKGSKEPLRRLPDGALATRRIVFWCVAAAAVRGAVVRPVLSARGGSWAVRGSQRRASAAKLCRRADSRRWARTSYRDATG